MPVSAEPNRRILLKEYGRPLEAAGFDLGSAPTEPAAGEVLVRVHYAPINPADLNVLEGRYGKLPASLPAVVGNEGAGVVAAVGSGVEGLRAGDPVFFLDRADSWQDFVLAEAGQLLPLPAGLDLRAACMLKVNPMTAGLLLGAAGELEPGSWIAQNAANSGVGRAVIALAKARGLRTLNFARRGELADALLAAGGDLAFTDDDAGREAALGALAGAPVPLALNAVGGESALRLMSLLGEGGAHVTYGAMAKAPLKVPNSFLIFKGITVRGLWLSKWLETTPRQEIAAAYARLADAMASGDLPQPVDSTFPPERIAEALARAAEGGRSGKVLLDFR